MADDSQHPQAEGLRPIEPLAMFHSPSIGAISKAIAAAQGRITPADQDRVNPHFKYSYATLSSVWNACRKPLSDAGIAVFQVTRWDGEELVLETLMSHESGEWIRATYPIKPVKADPQGYGSALTYARRYSLAALVGVSSDREDDDGEAGSGRGRGSDREDSREEPRSNGNGGGAPAGAEVLGKVKLLRLEIAAADTVEKVKAFMRANAKQPDAVRNAIRREVDAKLADLTAKAERDAAIAAQRASEGNQDSKPPAKPAGEYEDPGPPEDDAKPGRCLKMKDCCLGAGHGGACDDVPF